MTPVMGYSQMKDSGAAWLGHIPEEWGVSKIGTLYTQRNDKVSDKDYPPLSVTMKGILPQLATAAKTDDGDNRKLVKVGDFAINSRSDRRGSCGISPYDGSVSLINTVLTPRKAMHPGYYNWLFHTSLFADEFYKWGHGIVDDLWTTRWSEMKRILVPVPPYETQGLIATYLDTQIAKIDEIIAEAKASIEDYKQWKASVIYEAVTKGLDPDVEMKESGVEWIGKVPKNWNFIKITRILDRNHPYPLGDGDHGLIKTTDYIDSGIPYIRVQNLGWGTELQLENIVYISREKNDAIRNSTLRPNDVLFAKTGATIGKTGIVPDDIKIANTTSHVGKITVSPEYNPKFVFYVLSSYVGYNQFWEIASAKTTRPELSIEETKSVRIILPRSRQEQDEIVDYLDEKCPSIDALILEKESLIADLESYKKSLIYEVVTGKRRVTSAV